MADKADVLALFHKARRIKQIREKLEAAMDAQRTDLQGILRVMEIYAAWQPNIILVKQGVLYKVLSAAFILPDIADMCPQYNYAIRPIKAIGSEGEYHCEGLETIYPSGQGHYKIATQADIDRVRKTLPVIAPPKPPKPKKFKPLSDADYAAYEKQQQERRSMKLAERAAKQAEIAAALAQYRATKGKV